MVVVVSLADVGKRMEATVIALVRIMPQNTIPVATFLWFLSVSSQE